MSLSGRASPGGVVAKVILLSRLTENARRRLFPPRGPGLADQDAGRHPRAQARARGVLRLGWAWAGLAGSASSNGRD
jgi:hypothetical protein